MLLFIVSLILIFTSSYFLASIFDSKTEKGLIYTFLFAFAQIILCTEILSLFKQIKELPFIGVNIIFFIISFLFWKHFNFPKWKFDTKDFLHRLKNCFKLDKSLLILAVCWAIFAIISIVLIVIVPTITGDGKSYHVTRCLHFLINQSLAHFECANIRLTAFPLNSEILYTWVLLFTNKFLCLGIFSFIGYLLTCISSYKIIRFFGFSMRKALWTVLIFSSFANVIITSIETETDLIIAGLISLTIYLFLESLKTNSNKTLYVASLAYAIAIGVKTTALLLSPALLFVLFLFSLKFSKIKRFATFLVLTFANFIIFSSYNYILNFLDFGNFLNSRANCIIHQNNFGIKGMCASLVKYSKMFLDFSGCQWNEYITTQLDDYYSRLLTLLHLQNIPDGACSSDKFIFNNSLIGINAGCGLLSFLLVLPCFICSVITPIFQRKKKTVIVGIFGLMLIINLIVFSYFLAFMSFNIRFFVSMILVSSPMLIYSYYKSNRNILKILYVVIACCYFVFSTCNVDPRPIKSVFIGIKRYGIVQFREDYNCLRHLEQGRFSSDWCHVSEILKERFNKPEYKVLIYARSGVDNLHEMMKNRQGFNYEFKNIDTTGINPDDYDILITPRYGQYLTNFKKSNIDVERKDLNNIPQDTEYFCFYINFEDSISKIHTPATGKPVYKKCFLTKKFYQNHPFKMYALTQEYNILYNKNSISKFK